jgi:hypothetical protein
VIPQNAGLLSGNLARQGRLIRIHDSLHQHRPWSTQRLFNDITAGLGLSDRQADASARASDHGEIDWLQLDTVLGIAEHDHLFPADHAQVGLGRRN